MNPHEQTRLLLIFGVSLLGLIALELGILVFRDGAAMPVRVFLN